MVKRHTRGGKRRPGVVRRVATLLVCVVVAACGEAPVPQIPIGYRNPTAPLGGTSRFDQRRFAGEWHAAACLGPCDSRVRYVAAPNGILIRDAGGSETPFRVSAPGILRQIDTDQTLVVMWIDEGFRTAVVGNADGRWAVVLDRQRPAGADRVEAATEILDFNGWDVSQLRKIK